MKLSWYFPGLSNRMWKPVKIWHNIRYWKWREFCPLRQNLLLRGICLRNTAQVFVTSPRRPMLVNVEFVDKVTLRQAYLGAVSWAASANIITLIIHIPSCSLSLPTVIMQDSYSGINLQRSDVDLRLVFRFNIKLHFQSWIFPAFTVDFYIYSVNKPQNKTKTLGRTSVSTTVIGRRSYVCFLAALQISMTTAHKYSKIS